MAVRRRHSAMFVLVVLLVSLAVLAPAALADKGLAPSEVGEKAYTYVDALTRITNPDGTYTNILRAAGTADEVAAAGKVQGWLSDAGYVAEIQPFTYTRQGVMYNSQNVVAFRPADLKRKVDPTPLVIVGAHYDAVTAGAGADDNASGVAVMLEVAERMAKYKIEYDLIFVAFGAEEAGLRGSFHFVDEMSPSDIERTIVMINFDSLIVGDKLYIHAGFNEKTWARDEMLRLIELRKLPIEIQPGLHPDYPAGLTPDWFSDYTAFNQAGIPIVAFESTNWEIGDLDGYEQTESEGSFWHTPRDTLETIEALFPDRPMVRLNAYTKLTFEFLKHLNP
jgi:alkaline phosphatase isozyme conversion protein